MNYNEFFEDLAANSSRNYKIAKLEEHKDDELLKEIVRLAIDPFTNFYIRKIPDYAEYDADVRHRELSDAIEQLSVLYSRNVTGNAAIEFLSILLSSVTPDNAKVLERIIQKDLKCGVSASTANKVWDRLVIDYPCMLAEQCKEKTLNGFKFPALVQKKEDGLRFNAVVVDGKVTYFARSGKPLEIFGAMDEDFLAMSGGHNVVFDGELLVKKNGKILSRKEGNGILSKAIKGTITEKDASLVVCQLWDYIVYDAFKEAIWTKPYHERWALLNHAIDSVEPEKVAAVDNHFVENIEEAMVIADQYIADGFEGIIIKETDGIWENKRSKSQLKVKQELTVDLKVVRMVEGTGKYKGMLGAVECETSDGVITTSVGSGFNDKQREQYWKEDITGKIVEVKYNERIIDKKGNHSLFLPIFLIVRDDKTEANSSDEVG